MPAGVGAAGVTTARVVLGLGRPAREQEDHRHRAGVPTSEHGEPCEPARAERDGRWAERGEPAPPRSEWSLPRPSLRSGWGGHRARLRHPIVLAPPGATATARPPVLILLDTPSPVG